MSWVSLAAYRHVRLGLVKLFLSAPKTPSNLLDFGYVGWAAIETGDTKALEQLTALSRPLYELVVDGLDAEQLETVEGLGFALKYTTIFHIAGEDQRSVWKKFFKHGKPRDSSARALFELHASLLDKGTPAPPAAERRRRPLRVPATERAFVRATEQLSTADLLDIADTPGHPTFARSTQLFVPTLVLMRARELGVAPIVTASLGAWPDRRGEVLYTRTRARPQFGTKPSAKKSDTWFGFDALERKDNDLFAYHYVGASWQAPLAFEEDLDAYTFLSSLPYDWKMVQPEVSAETWEWIEEARRAGRCTHVVVYDPTNASAPKGAAEAAGEHYGVRLVAKSLFEV